MFFIGMMSIKEDIRAAYAAPKIETTEVRLETGIAQSAFGGRLRRGGRTAALGVERTYNLKTISGEKKV